MADQDGSIMQVSVTGDREIHIQEREREIGGEGGKEERGGREKEMRGEGKQRGEEERGRGMGKEEREEKRRERGIKGKEKKQAMKEFMYIQSSYLLKFYLLPLPFPSLPENPSHYCPPSPQPHVQAKAWQSETGKPHPLDEPTSVRHRQSSLL